jgi:hypothetical protein
MARIEMKLRRAFLLLAGAALFGAVAAYFEMARTTAQPSDRPVNSGEAGAQRLAARPAGAAVEPSATAGNPLWTLPLKQLSITRERPIFSPSRRPPPPVAAPVYVAPVATRSPPKPAEPDRPAVTLLGTIVGGAEGIGVFLESATRTVVRLRMGEDHQGWVLRSVKGREVTLEKAGATTVLELAPPGGDAAMLASDPMPEPPVRRPPRR